MRAASNVSPKGDGKVDEEEDGRDLGERATKQRRSLRCGTADGVNSALQEVAGGRRHGGGARTAQGVDLRAQGGPGY